MTRKAPSGKPSGVSKADPVEEAIRKLRALKEKRAQSTAPPDATPTEAPRKRGRPPKTPEQPAADRPGFGVSKPTAHRPLGLLEVQDKTDLDALLADPRLAPHIALRLDERFALVLPAHQERLQAALLKVGHTPRLSGPPERREAGRRDAP